MPLLFNIEHSHKFSLVQGSFIGVREEDNSSAYLSGVTIRDEVLMYAEMTSSKQIEGKIPSTVGAFKYDISKALNDRKHLILVLKREPYVY